MGSEINGVGMGVSLSMVRQTSGGQAEQSVSQSVQAKAQVASGETRLDVAQMQELAQRLNEKAAQIVQAQKLERGLQFTVDDSTEQTVIRVVDSQTNELIRQIPSDEALAISRHVQDFLANGDLLNVRA